MGGKGVNEKPSEFRFGVSPLASLKVFGVETEEKENNVNPNFGVGRKLREFTRSKTFRVRCIFIWSGVEWNGMEWML